MTNTEGFVFRVCLMSGSIFKKGEAIADTYADAADWLMSQGYRKKRVRKEDVDDDCELWVFPANRQLWAEIELVEKIPSCFKVQQVEQIQLLN